MADTELQARLLKDAIEASEKKRKLEEDIRIAETRSKLLLESAARKDIEVYKKRSLAAKYGN
ncbi:MAG TPA: hypothetical protein VH985_20440 [Candidatus Binatia bacterium]|jgi:hypothetical protein